MRNIFLILIVLCAPMLRAQTLPIEARVKQYCDARNYNSAISVLQGELTRSGSSPALYCNLGNVYYMAGNFGAATLNYSRALRLDPRNAQALNNLKVVRAQVQQLNEAECGDRNLDVSPASPDVMQSIGAWIASRGSNFWCVLSIVLFVLCITAVAIYLLVANVAVRKWGFFGAGALLLFSGISLGCSAVARNAVRSTGKAVVMTPTVTLKSNFAQESKDVAAPITGGTEVTVTDRRTDAAGTQWVRVYLNADYAGWLHAADVEVISVPGL